MVKRLERERHILHVVSGDIEQVVVVRVLVDYGGVRGSVDAQLRKRVGDVVCFHGSAARVHIRVREVTMKKQPVGEHHVNGAT